MKFEGEIGYLGPRSLRLEGLPGSSSGDISAGFGGGWGLKYQGEEKVVSSDYKE